MPTKNEELTKNTTEEKVTSVKETNNNVTGCEDMALVNKALKKRL